MENENNNDDLTPLQKAKKRYYEKIKNTEQYKNKRSSPEVKAKLRESSNKYYYKIRDDPEFKNKVSQQKKEYYQRVKSERLLEILV